MYLTEMRALVDQGVIEITLLGQNVNAYGVEFGDRGAFAKLLREAGKIDGLERVRFMSPHPRDFTDDVIEAMAETANVMPHLHMPLQSGSDAILQTMRRSYRTDKYLGILDRVRTAMPHAMITTDIIVGFPGETEEDFQGTLDIATKRVSPLLTPTSIQSAQELQQERWRTKFLKMSWESGTHAFTSISRKFLSISQSKKQSVRLIA